MYSFGEVVLVPFPFTDQSGAKKRPAVIVSSRGYNDSRRDLVIMAITGQTRTPMGFGEAHGGHYFEFATRNGSALHRSDGAALAAAGTVTDFSGSTSPSTPSPCKASRTAFFELTAVEANIHGILEAYQQQIAY